MLNAEDDREVEESKARLAGKSKKNNNNPQLRRKKRRMMRYQCGCKSLYGVNCPKYNGEQSRHVRYAIAIVPLDPSTSNKWGNYLRKLKIVVMAFLWMQT